MVDQINMANLSNMVKVANMRNDPEPNVVMAPEKIDGPISLSEYCIHLNLSGNTDST